MDALILEGTDNTPRVEFNPESSNFEISGESRPEDVRKFYEPIVDWLDKYNNHLYWILENNNGQKKNVTFKFRYEYFNSSSAKYVMDIMNKLSEIQENCKNAELQIEWYYDEMDEDMLEAGEEFQNITSLPFKFIIL
jgi:hypothetical protein